MNCSGVAVRLVILQGVLVLVSVSQHTGVVVFGKEYFFGAGIQSLEPALVVSRYGMEPMRYAAFEIEIEIA